MRWHIYIYIHILYLIQFRWKRSVCDPEDDIIFTSLNSCIISWLFVVYFIFSPIDMFVVNLCQICNEQSSWLWKPVVLYQHLCINMPKLNAEWNEFNSLARFVNTMHVKDENSTIINVIRSISIVHVYSHSTMVCIHNTCIQSQWNINVRLNSNYIGLVPKLLFSNQHLGNFVVQSARNRHLTKLTTKRRRFTWVVDCNPYSV